MKCLELAFFAGAVTHAPCETLLILIPEDERPLKRDAGLIDWRLRGDISKKLLSGYISGAEGEALLMQGQRPLDAGRILLIGVGSTRGLEQGSLRGVGSVIEDVTRRLCEIGCSEVALALPGAIDLERDARDLLWGIVRVLVSRSEVRLRLIIPDATRSASALEKAVAELREDARHLGLSLETQWLAAGTPVREFDSSSETF